MLGCLLVAILGIALVHPRTPLGALARLWLVERPAEALSRLTWRQVLLLVVLVVCVAAFAQAAMPADLAAAAAADAVTYLELVAATWLVAANRNARAVLRVLARSARQAARRPLRLPRRAGRVWLVTLRAARALRTRLGERRAGPGSRTPDEPAAGRTLAFA